MSPRSCPDPQTLQLLLRGRLPAAQREAWERHLLTCDQCAAAAETLKGLDGLTAAIDRGRDPTKLDSASAAQGDTEPASSRVSPAKFEFLAPPQQPGELGRLGDYRVLKPMGAGGMGLVFQAEDTRLRRPVAIKVMKPRVAAKRDSKERFLREARASAALTHDHIVQIYQVGEQSGVPFIAMQYLAGESLLARSNRVGKLPPAEVARIGKEVATGLAAAHEKGLIHRDIKPDNIWLEGKTGRAKILDFGLVRDSQDDVGLTEFGTIIGTPPYMAPEQITGDHVDHRADLFSLGSMLYRLAAGKPPFLASSVPALLYAISHSSPQPLSHAVSGIHPSLADLIHSLLRKSPDERPQSAETVARRLAEIESELVKKSDSSPTPQRPGGTTTRLASGRRLPPGRRHSLLAAAGPAAFALLLGVIVITIRSPDGTETTIRVAEGTSIPVRGGGGGEIEMEPRAGVLDATRPLSAPGPRGIARTDREADANAAAGDELPGTTLGPTPPQPLGSWEKGPEPPWFGEGGHDVGYSILDSDVLPGLVERPTQFASTRRWNVDTKWGRGTTLAARYSPDGKLLATSNSDGHARIFDAQSMELLALLPGKTTVSGMDDLSWGPDSKRLVVAIPYEKVARIWSIDGRLLFEENLDVRCHSVAWSPDGKWIAEGFQARVQLRRPDGTIDKVLCEGDGSGPSSGGMLVWHPDGRHLACWRHDGRLVIWDCENGSYEQLREPLGHRGHPGQRMAWSDSGLLAVALGDRLEIYGPDHILTQTVDYQGRGAIAWHPDNDRLFMWDGRSVRSWSIRTQTFVDETTDASSGWPHQPLALSCSPDGDRLAIAACLVRVLSSDLRTRHFETPIYCRYGTSLGWSHDGKYLASTTEGFHAGLPVWGADGKAAEVIPVALESLPLALSWSPTDMTLVGISKGQASVISRDMAPATVLTGADDAHSVAWSPDGSQLAFGTGDGTVKIFEASGQQITEMIAGDRPAFVAWSAANGQLWVHCGHRLYRCRPQESWTLIFVEETSEPAVTSPSWYPDGGLVAVRSTGWFGRDGTRVAGPSRPRPITWRHDGNAYVAFSRIVINTHFPGGAPIATRYLNGHFEQIAYRYQPYGSLLAVAFGESAITLLHDEDLQPYWHAVLLPEMRSATFSAAGELLDGAPDIVDPFLAYYFEDGSGRIETVTPGEFRERFAGRHAATDESPVIPTQDSRSPQ